MASESISLDSDIAVSWYKNGSKPTHYESILDTTTRSSIYAISTPQTDLFGMTAPSGTVDALTKFTFTVEYDLIINSGGGWIGANYQMYDGDMNFLGGYLHQVITPDVLTPWNLEITLTGGAAEAANLRMYLIPQGSNWTPASAAIRLYAFYNQTLHYTEPAANVPPEYTCTSGIDSTGSGTSTGFLVGACTRGIDDTGSGTSTGYKTGSGTSTGFKTGSGNSYIKEP